MLEVADVFAVNKSDRAGAERMARELREMLELARPGPGLSRDSGGHHGTAAALPTGARSCAGRRIWDTSDERATDAAWDTPVVLTVANDGTGVDELLEALEGHRAWLGRSGHLRDLRRSAVRHKVAGLVEASVREVLWGEGRGDQLEALAERIVDREETPYGAARTLLDAWRGGTT